MYWPLLQRQPTNTAKVVLCPNKVTIFNCRFVPYATFSYANWGPQHASVPSPSQPPKIIDTNNLRLLYGHVTYRSGDPISWSVFQESRSSRSSCESEIKSADEAMRVTQHLFHVLSALNMHNATKPTPVYNDNQGC
jgi:hypothetical protein